MTRQTHRVVVELAKRTPARVLRSFISNLYSTLHEDNQVRELNYELLMLAVATTRGIPIGFDSKSVANDKSLDADLTAMNEAIQGKGITEFPATFINGLILQGESRVCGGVVVVVLFSWSLRVPP